MNPFTLFWDMIAVAAGLAVNGGVLGSLALAGLYLLGRVRDAAGKP